MAKRQQQAMVYYPITKAYQRFGQGTYQGQLQSTRAGNSFVTTRRKKSTPFSRMSFKKQVESVQPAKHLTSTPGVTSLDDEIYTYGLTTQIVQGTGNTQRIADSIHIAAVKWRGFISTPAASGAYNYRLLIGWSGEEYTTSNFTASGLTALEIFLPITVTRNVNGIINPKAFTCIYDATIDINSTISNVSDLASFETTVQINQDHDYQASSSSFGKTRNLYLIVIPQVVGGTPSTTAAGTFTTSVDLIFK